MASSAWAGGKTSIEGFDEKPLAEVPWHASAQPLGPRSLLLSFENSVNTHMVELNSLECSWPANFKEVTHRHSHA